MGTSNPSVRGFRTGMLNLAKDIGKGFHQEALAQADELIGNMRNAIQHSVSGHLAQSIRKKDVSTSDDAKISVLVLAGGQLTTRGTSTGHSHDYSLDEEFGNVKETARPFFYSTFRFYQRGGEERFRETLDQMIETNNQQRQSRSDNYYKIGDRATIGSKFGTVSSTGRSKA